MKKTKKSTYFFAGISFIALAILAGLLNYYKLLPPVMRNVGLVVLLFVQILFATFYSKSGKALAFIMALLLLIYTSALAYGSFVVYKTMSSLEKMTNKIEMENKGDDKVNGGSVDTGDKPKVDPNVDNNAFNIYLSGIDTYGNLKNVSRSDVNLVVTVNRTTRKIKITTIPRDSYVRIADGGHDQYDKLTHAGIYGVGASMHTLENLFDTKIPYYARVNFTSVKDIVNALGGITVTNDQNFTAFNGKYFPKGELTLNGEDALAFARERKSLNDGDFDRGRHHIKLIEAIIRKVSSPELLKNFSNLLDIAARDVDTNMSTSLLVELANNEILASKGWDISQADVKGTGSMGLPSYAMPGYKLYMFKLDPNSVSEISTSIKDILEGK